MKGDSMSALPWMIARGFPALPVAASLAAVGAVTGLLLLAFRQLKRTNMKTARIQRQLANIAGEVSVLRDESECRWLMQQLYATDPEQARGIFGPSRENYGGR